MPIIITPNMSLPVPVVGQELGPQYATDINNCMVSIDAHNHTLGSGVQIPSGGLNINSDLTFVNNRATNLKSATFFVQGSLLAPTMPDLGALYVSGVDLYYNDVDGNQIQITSNGNVNAGSGSISGLVSPASASYVAGNSTFVWQSNVNTAAAMDNGPVTIREIAANANGITIQSPIALAADYSLTLPGALPGVTSLVTVDTSGNLGFTPPLVDGGQIISSTVPVFDQNTAGTYMFVVPNNIHRAQIRASSSGGGGGANAGGGGGGGGYIDYLFAVVPGETLTINVGTGGAGGTAGGPGSSGTDTDITGSSSGLIVSLIAGRFGTGTSGTGGLGFYLAEPGRVAGVGGAGGTGVKNGLVYPTGVFGGLNTGGNSSGTGGGGGGGSWGSGGAGGANGNAGSPGTEGGGGGGGGASGNGGRGSDGFVTIWLV